MLCRYIRYLSVYKYRVFSLVSIPILWITSLVATSVYAETKMYFIHNDHLGTPQAVTDENQNIVWRGRQQPFGQTEETTDTIDQQARFPGQYLDEETSVHYNYFRDYDPSIGRYIQSDPIGLGGGLNTYGYVVANPYKYSDLYGLDINVSMNSEGAGGFGHVGGAANSSETSGFYPTFPSSLAPGVVKPDENTDGEVVIPATPEQDKKFTNCMETRRKNPGVYALITRNCTRLIQSCLSQAGIGGINNSTLPKKFFCSIAKKYGCEGDFCDQCE